MINPDKHIRKYFFDALNNQVVDTKTITVHDYRAPTNKDEIGRASCRERV